MGMAPYWLLILVPAWAALLERPVSAQRRIGLSWALLGLLLTVLLGLRYEVGADWYNYINHLHRVSYLSFEDVVSQTDPGYYLLNWVFVQLDIGLWAVNLVCAALFSYGLLSFSRQQPRPWLAVAVSVPYLVVVVAMGYTRQGVAIGGAMLGLAVLAKGSIPRFVACVAVAATFHKSAALLIPLAALAATERRIWTALWVACAGALLYHLFLDQSVDTLMSTYVERQRESQGTLIRVIMNALPAAFFLVFRHRIAQNPRELKLWTYLSLAALGALLLFFISPSSTAVDRVALYLIPIQIFVLSRLPGAIAHGPGEQQIASFIVAYSLLVLFVWLNFASHADSWVPYKFYPFEHL